MTILASRTHTCIHPKVSKSSNKDEGCKQLVNPKKTASGPAHEEGSCSFYQNIKKNPIVYENLGFKQVWDIEELMKSLKRKRMCPYYAARELMDSVDIVFCPYNYLIDPKIRSSMKINLDDQIVIVDEAHNVEDACRESANTLITKIDLDARVNELRELVNSACLSGDIKQSAEFLLDMVSDGCLFDTQGVH